MIIEEEEEKEEESVFVRFGIPTVNNIAERSIPSRGWGRVYSPLSSSY